MSEIVVNEAKSVEHTHRNAEPLKVKLVKGQRDSYGWEISCSGATLGDILSQVRAADMALRSEYGGA
jgi:hypothetical protein